MRILSLVFAVTASLMALPMNAVAGAKNGTTTVISGTWAAGSMGAARNSADPDELVMVTDRGSSILLSVTDENRNRLYCNTTNQQHMQVIRGMTESSYFEFYVNPDGSCNMVKSINGSHLMPKVL